MTVKAIPEQDVLQEAAEVLGQHLSPAKVARCWAAWQMGSGTCRAIRDPWFAAETVTTLCAKVRRYQAARQAP